MNCPMHNLIFGRAGGPTASCRCACSSSARCTGTRSPASSGLTRVRGLTMDGSHSYVTPEQAPGEIRHLLDFVLGLLRDFGLSDYYLELSTRGDDPAKMDKFIGSDEEWANATAVLEQAAVDSGWSSSPARRRRSTPKISVQARDAIGRTWQMSTIQYDFNQPARFGLEFQRCGRHAPAAGDPLRRSSAPSSGSSASSPTLRRRVPAWLAPVQVVGIPITDEQVPYLMDVAEAAPPRRARIEIDDSDDRMQKKIRTASKQKIPFVLIAGATDAEAGAVSRYRDGSQRGGVPVAEAVEQIAALGRLRHNTDPTATPVGGAPGGRMSTPTTTAGPHRLRSPLDAVPHGLHPRRGKPQARTTARSA